MRHLYLTYQCYLNQFIQPNQAHLSPILNAHMLSGTFVVDEVLKWLADEMDSLSSTPFKFFFVFLFYLDPDKAAVWKKYCIG